MGSTSGGSPGPSGTTDMKGLLEKTREKFLQSNPRDRHWPCPFCLHKAKTVFQCLVHVKKEHRNITSLDKNGIFNEIGSDVSQSSNENSINTSLNELKEFLRLNQEEESKNENVSNNSNPNAPICERSLSSDEDEYFSCPYCTEERSFPTLRGLNVHIGKKHKGKKKITLDQLEYENINIDEYDLNDIGLLLALLRKTTPTLRRCPKGARQNLASTLTNVINNCVRSKNEQSWNALLLFPYTALRLPEESENVINLTTFVRQNIQLWNENKINVSPRTESKTKAFNTVNDNEKHFSKKVEAKLADGDVSGALRLIVSDDVIAPNNQDTLDSLKQKHPIHPEPTNYPDHTIDIPQMIPIEEEVSRAIMSFRKGSAGGLDSLRPQILKDLLHVQNGDAGRKLLEAITALTTVILSGEVPSSICPYFYGASLTALMKKTGGIRPIAVGTTWRRLSAKIACRRVASVLSNLFLPNQLGVGIPNGAEAGAHAARIYYTSRHNGVRVFLKIDVKNAFNEIRRDALLRKVKSTVPEIYKFVEQCYRLPTNVYYREHVISSQRGVHQGDPLGPALFCLVVQDIISSLEDLDLNIWYLDDGTIAGSPNNVLKAFRKIIILAQEIGLELNYAKCELSILSFESDESKLEIEHQFKSIAAGIQTMKPENEFLLGSPLTDAASTICLNKKILDLQNLTKRLKNISMHSAYYLLRISITTPRLIFFLRGSPMWRNESGLSQYDEVLKSSIESIFNIELNDNAWIESSLPIKKGGIGIRHASDIALPCFLSSLYNVSALLDQLLPENYRQVDMTKVESEDHWCRKFGELPEESLRIYQGVWESYEINQKIEILEHQLNVAVDKARFLANTSKESGAWLHSLPSPQLGTHLNNDEFRISIGLRLGAAIVQPHKCVCGTKVNKYGRHGLSCSKASGTLPRHGSGNDLIQRALRSAEIPCKREPTGCSRKDGKRADGLTLVPWSKGKSLLWDFTCADTFANSYVNRTARELGWAASQAEDKKFDLYSELMSQYIFVPIATETSGVIGKCGLDLIKKIGSKITERTHEKRATSYLIQRLGLVIQRGNVASVLGTLPPSKNLNEIYYL